MGEFPNRDTQFQPGESGNPAGKPKGAVHLSTRIQNMMDDPEFQVYLQHPTEGFVPFKGAPAEAIIRTALQKAAAGDKDAREWLAKYGYGTKVELGGRVDGNLVIKMVSYEDQPEDGSDDTV